MSKTCKPLPSRRVALAALAVALIIPGQIVAPAIAGRVVRSQLDDIGEVRSVEVRAFPWVKLLVGRADHVVVRMRTERLEVSPDLAERIAMARRVDRVDLSVDSAEVGAVRMRDVVLRKDGPALTATAAITTVDLIGALPFADIEATAGPDRSLVFEAQVLGVAAPVAAEIAPEDGRLRLVGTSPLGSLGPSLTIFDEPEIAVKTLEAVPRADGFALTATARLR